MSVKLVHTLLLSVLVPSGSLHLSRNESIEAAGDPESRLIKLPGVPVSVAQPPGAEKKGFAALGYGLYAIMRLIDTCLEQYLHWIGYQAPSSLAAAAEVCVNQDSDVALMGARGHAIRRPKKAFAGLKSRETRKDRLAHASAAAEFLGGKEVRYVTVDSNLVDCVAKQFDDWVPPEFNTDSAKSWLDFLSTIGEAYLMPWLIDANKRAEWDDLKKTQQLQALDECKLLKMKHTTEFESLRATLAAHNDMLCSKAIEDAISTVNEVLKNVKDWYKQLVTAEEENQMWYCGEALGLTDINSNELLVVDAVSEEISWLKNQANMIKSAMDGFLSNDASVSDFQKNMGVKELPMTMQQQRKFTCIDLFNDFMKTGKTFTYTEAALVANWDCCQYIDEHMKAEATQGKDQCEKMEKLYRSDTKTLNTIAKSGALDNYIQSINNQLNSSLFTNIEHYREPNEGEKRMDIKYCKLIDS